LIRKKKIAPANKIVENNISRFAIFSGLSKEQQKRVSQLLSKRHFDSDKVIAREGEQGDELFLLLSGEVEVSKRLTLMAEDENMGEKNKSLIRLKDEFAPYFGEMAILNKESKRSASIRAVTKCCVGVVNRTDLIELCQLDKEVGYIVILNIAKNLAKNFEKANQNILKLTTAFSLALQN
jgi:CRP/FNR family transcriptional regulator, cyclic AMP receptor protein